MVGSGWMSLPSSLGHLGTSGRLIEWLYCSCLTLGSTPTFEWVSRRQDETGAWCQVGHLRASEKVPGLVELHHISAAMEIEEIWKILWDDMGRYGTIWDDMGRYR